MIKAGVIGATGYAGAELVRILDRHPRVQLEVLTTRSYKGSEFSDVYPNLKGHVSIKGEGLDTKNIVERCDLVFTALPHGHAVDIALECKKRGKKFIDIGADLRFRDADLYEKWYKIKPDFPEIMTSATYGLTELNREAISRADLVGNPGCYPTGAILALAPLLKNALVDTNSIIIDSKSGVSGAGRGLSLTSHYAEINENIKAYNIGVHRHTPEIEQELSIIAGEDVVVSFTPHLTPMTRGILTSTYAQLKKAGSTEDIIEYYREFYAEEPFIRVLPEGVLPQTKAVYASNHCDIGVVVDPRTKRVVVLSAIDNLVKGASGQAVQNMNIMLGFDEKTALDYPGIYP